MLTLTRRELSNQKYMAHGGNRILKQTNLPNDMDILICKGEIFELMISHLSNVSNSFNSLSLANQ